VLSKLPEPCLGKITLEKSCLRKKSPWKKVAIWSFFGGFFDFEKKPTIFVNF
jgi:hypothetical protein